VARKAKLNTTSKNYSEPHHKVQGRGPLFVTARGGAWRADDLCPDGNAAGDPPGIVNGSFNPDRKDTHWGKRKLKRDQMTFGLSPLSFATFPSEF
jgi:hypothetical protein